MSGNVGKSLYCGIRLPTYHVVVDDDCGFGVLFGQMQHFRDGEGFVDRVALPCEFVGKRTGQVRVKKMMVMS